MRPTSASERPARRWLLLAAFLVAALGIAGALVTTPEPARAKKGYGGGGGYGYKQCNRACHVAKCRKACGKTKRTCVFCVRKDKTAGGVACTQTATQSLAACTGDKTCKTGVKSALKACKAQVKDRFKQAKGNCAGLTGNCRGCCGENYQGACGGVFRGTDGYGTSFRTYGNKNYRPDCTTSGEPAPGDPQCQGICDRIYFRAVAVCGGGKRSAPVRRATGTPRAVPSADPACVAQADADRLACLARCGVSPSTTTTSTLGPALPTSTTFGPPVPTSTTSTTAFPGSPRGAFVH